MLWRNSSSLGFVGAAVEARGWYAMGSDNEKFGKMLGIQRCDREVYVLYQSVCYIALLK